MSKKTLFKQVLFGRIQRYIWLCLFLIAFSFLSTFFNDPQKVEAAASNTMNFQARLLQSSGALVPDGYYNVEFKLYNAQNSSGSSTGSCAGDSSCVWTETYKQTNRVRVANGYLTVNLGAIQAFSGNINWDQEHWLTMNIGGTTNTASPSWDGEMTPRLKLTAVPHAFTAGKLQKTNGGNTSTLSFDDQTASRNILLPDESGKICLQGSTNCGFVSGAAGDFIQNGTNPQTANFNVSGNGTIGGALSVPTIDRATAGTLNIGTTTATAVTIGRISGTVNIAGGNINLQGNTAVSAGNSLTVSSGELAITGRSSGSNTTLRVNNHTSTGNIFVAQDAATDVFIIADGGSVLSKVNSTTAFQIQNANATNNLFIADTQNTRIGIGATPATSLLTIGTNTTTASGGITFGADTNLYRSAANTLKTDGTFDAATYSVGGVAGLAASCTGGQMLQNQVIVGGIVTGGTCVSGGASALQGAYNGGNTITTTDARDISFTLADTATDGNFLVNVASGSTGKFAIQSNGIDTFSVGPTGNVLSKNTINSTAAFQIQNAAGQSLFTVDTANSNITLAGNLSGQLQAWQTSPNTLPDGDFRAGAAVAANGYIYSIGGNDGSSKDEVYYTKVNANGSIGAWATNANSLPIALNNMAVTVANGYLYVLGGTSNGVRQSTVYYAKLNADGSTGTWKTNANALPVRTGLTANATNGYIYAVGGIDNSGAYQRTVYYAKLNADGSTGTWSTNVNELPGQRALHASVVANGYMYVLGGSDGSTRFNTVYYAPINNNGSIGSWTPNTNVLPAALDSIGSVIANGHIYVIGGYNGSTNVNTVYYAPINNNGSIGSWTPNTNNLPYNMSANGVVTVNGYIYTVAGTGDSSWLNVVHYSSTPRIQVGASLDLVGLSGESLTDEGSGDGSGSLGGSLTAGNTNIVGSLQVRGDSTFSQGVNVGGNLNVNGSVMLQNTTDSTSAFRVQDSSGNQIFNVDTLTTSGSLISNASIETDTAGWTAKGSATLTRSTAQKYVGNASLQIGATVAAGDGAKYNVALTPSTIYGLSLYARKTVPPDLTAFEVGYSADGSTDTSCSPSGTIVSGGWSRITCTFATPSSVSGSYIYIKKTNTTGQTIFIDAVQLSSVNNFPYYSGAISLQAPVTSTALFMSNVNSTTAFQIQNAGGNSDLFIANTVSNKIGIGVAPSNTGARLQVAGDIDIQGGLLRFNGVQLSSAHLLDNADLAKLNADQTFTGNNSFLGQTTFQAPSGISLVVKEASSGISQDILAVKTVTDLSILRVIGYGGNNASLSLGAIGTGYIDISAQQNHMTLSTSGVSSDIRINAGRAVTTSSQFQATGSGDGTSYGTLFKNNTNSSTAFAIQNAAGGNVFVVNTTNGSIGINKTPNTTFSLDVGGNVNFANNMTVGAIANISNTVSVTNPSLSVGQYTKHMTAGAGGVSQFDVVVLDSNGNVVKTTVPRNPQVYGVVPNGIAASATGAVAIAGNITVNVDTAAVAVGDQLVTSSTAGRATVDNSATTGIIGTALSIKAAGSNGTVSMAIRPVGGQYAPKFRNAVDSSNGFQIQRSDGSNVLTADTGNTRILMGSATSPTLSSAQLVVTVTEVQTTLRVGNATNGFSFNDTSTGESGKLRLYGTARNTKKIVLTPEYAGAVLSNTASACGGSDTGMGAMTAGFDTVATPNKNYYKWTSTQANCQSYDLIIQVSVPSDWSAWAASNAFSIDGWSDNLTNSTGNATAIGSNGTTDVNATSITPGATSTWTTTGSSLNSAHYTADGIMTIKLRMTAANNSSFRLGNVTLTYLSKF